MPEDVPLLLKPYVREDLAAKLTLVVGGGTPQDPALPVGS
jgi:hypothetical protein